jgi:uncharacterized iron-regulated protein
MKTLIFTAFFGFNMLAAAAPEGLYNGSNAQKTSLQEALKGVQPGSVVVLGESHGFQVIQNQQIQVMETLRQAGLKVSVGLEFFPYVNQSQVNEYRAGTLSEADFLRAVSWGAIDYAFYKKQAEFPNLSEGAMTVALNAPQWLATKIGKEGSSALTPDEKAFLPPQFTLGNANYKQRFVESVPHAMPPEKMDKFFEAQSLWDDTMAWNAQQFISQHPDQVLVIVVGEFHVQYGGGLPDRLRARGVKSVLTISQVDTSEVPDDQIGEVLAPSPRDGQRADYLWLAPLVP